MSGPRCARRARAIAQTYSGAANQATEAWVGPAFRNVPRPSGQSNLGSEAWLPSIMNGRNGRTSTPLPAVQRRLTLLRRRGKSARSLTSGSRPPTQSSSPRDAPAVKLTVRVIEKEIEAEKAELLSELWRDIA